MKLGTRHRGAYLNPSSPVEGCKFEANYSYTMGSHLKEQKQNKNPIKPSKIRLAQGSLLESFGIHTVFEDLKVCLEFPAVTDQHPTPQDKATVYDESEWI